MIDYTNEENKMGIDFLHPIYINAKVNQSSVAEMRKAQRFAQEYAIEFCKQKGFSPRDCNFQFINYGKTELVFVLTLPDNQRFTFLVKQPAIKLGSVKKEAVHLTNLAKEDNSVIAPISYYQKDEHEGFVTPYIEQARCVASDEGWWGIYVPEPYYRFEKFSEEQRRIVNTCMIAKLVSFYDFSSRTGVAKAKLGGGDFMLPKGWEKKHPTIEGTLNELMLIACREKVYMPFERYLDVLRREFSQRTINKYEKDCLINVRGRAPMTKEEIEDGIVIGKQLLKEKKLAKNSEADKSDKI